MGHYNEMCHNFLAGTIRVILFGLNLATLLAGGVLLGCGVYVKISITEFAELNNMDAIETTAYFLIAIGSLVVVLSLVGCLGACLQNHVLLAFYFVLMMLLLLAEVSIGILYAVEKTTIGTEIDAAVEDAISNYGEGSATQDEAIDTIQTFLECCGYSGPLDYDLIKLVKLPKSCCRGDPELCTLLNAHQIGCKQQIDKTLASQSMVVIIVVSAVALLEMMTMLGACYLRRRELADIDYTIENPPYSM